MADLIDLSEDATPEQYALAIEAANKDKSVDGVMVLHSPKFGTDALGIAQRIAQLRGHISKPVLSCWMGDATVAEARAVLAEASIPTFRTPEAASSFEMPRMGFGDCEVNLPHAPLAGLRD